MPRPDSEEFEKLIHRTLRSLPERRAPRSLELRVLAAIEARQSLPWWRQSFAHWPHAAQAVFLLLSGVIAAILVTLVFRTGAEVEAASPWTSAMSNLRHARLVLASLGEACAAVFRGIPPLWLYGGLAFLAAMYATLVGLGAAAYRTFFHHR
jgi:hypothetical protein